MAVREKITTYIPVEMATTLKRVAAVKGRSVCQTACRSSAGKVAIITAAASGAVRTSRLAAFAMRA